MQVPECPIQFVDPGGWGAENSKASVRDRASEATITLSLRFWAAVRRSSGLIMSDWRNSGGDPLRRATFRRTHPIGT